jgi:hypothetical protein
VREGEGTVFCGDPELDARIQRLHDIARTEGGSEVQCHIDAYLPAAGFLLEGGDAWAARMMVLNLSDVPQEGRLPDLGPILRATLVGSIAPPEKGRAKERSEAPPPAKKPKAAPKRPGGHPGFQEWAEEDLSVQMLYKVIPSLKRGQRNEPSFLTRQQVGLNILMALLLGLYSHAVKFPPFGVRVRVFKKIHRLITGGKGEEFCRRHQSLLALAYMEYFSRAIPAYLPAEYEVLKTEPGMEAFFASCPLACDTLRQEVLDEEVDWAKLEAYSAGVVDRHGRACKNRQRQRIDEEWAWGGSASEAGEPQVQTRGSQGKAPIQSRILNDALAVQSFCAMPYLRPYATHLDDHSNCIISSELAFLFGEEVRLPAGATRQELFASVAAMQRGLSIHTLPRNLIDMQLRGLHAQMRVCERSARDAMLMYVCASCCLASGGHKASFQRGKCRLNAGRLVCAECQSQAVVRINTLGRVVALRGGAYYLAPCCFTIQPYKGTGLEFQTEFCDPDFFGPRAMERMAWRPDVNPGMCTHRRPGRGGARQQRPRCEVCVENRGGVKTGGGSAAPELFSAVDHLTGERRSIYLCQRHAPHGSVLEHVANWQELMSEVQARDKPLFSGRRK